MDFKTPYSNNISMHQNAVSQAIETLCLIPYCNSKNNPCPLSITYSNNQKNITHITGKRGNLAQLMGYPTLTCSRVDHGVCPSRVKTSIRRPADSVVNGSSWYRCRAATITGG